MKRRNASARGVVCLAFPDPPSRETGPVRFSVIQGETSRIPPSSGRWGNADFPSIDILPTGSPRRITRLPVLEIGLVDPYPSSAMVYRRNRERAGIFRITHFRNRPWILRNGPHCRNSKVLDPAIKGELMIPGIGVSKRFHSRLPPKSLTVTRVS